MNISDKWALLGQALLEGKGFKSLRLSEECVLELFLAIDQEYCRYLILHLPEGFQPNVKILENENIVLTYSSSKQLIAIKLLDIDFSDLFDDLIKSIFNTISNESSVEVASKRFVDKFIKWNKFFSKLESKVYSENTILGLWGELFTLYKYIEKKPESTQINNIIEAWTGPIGAVHDFTFKDKSIEIKTKLSSKNSINIASEFQLGMSNAEGLELCVLNVCKENDGQSIEALYKNLKRRILDCGGDLSLLLSRLLALKLDEQSLSRYNEYTYKAIEANYYDCLNPAFPKIVHDELNDEIFSVKYKLDVSNLRNFILNTEKY